MSERTLVNRDAQGNHCCPITPDAVHAAVDLTRLWTRRKPKGYELAPFNRCFPRITEGSPYAPFPIWWLDFPQPDADALDAIARRQHWRLYRSEFALDWDFADPAARSDATAWHRWHFDQPRHRDQVCVFDEITRYTRDRFTRSGRPTRINFADYDDQRSKISGQPCLHIEARIGTADALRRAGVYRADDLIDFDHRAFWQKHLRYRALDCARFGRALLNCQRNSRRRAPLPPYTGSDGRRYDVDTAVGGLCLLASGSIQQLLHDCDQHTTLNVRDYLIAIPTPQRLLPVITYYIPNIDPERFQSIDRP